MKEKIDQGKPLLILVRDTHYDIYSTELRKRMIEATMANMGVDAKVMIIDDIESVNYGRGVGYEINEIEVGEDIKSISATEIREKIDNNDSSWKDMMPRGADKVLENYLTDKGVVVWFTGLSGAGKTTIANASTDILRNKGVKTERLDGDVLRKSVTKDLGFTKEDRKKNLERASFIAGVLARNGVVVLSSFITPYKSVRNSLREELGKNSTFIEVYVKASLETCKERDPKGLYKKVEKGEIENFTGIDDPYEEPENPDLVIDTEKLTINQSASKLAEFIESVVK